MRHWLFILVLGQIVFSISTSAANKNSDTSISGYLVRIEGIDYLTPYNDSTLVRYQVRWKMPPKMACFRSIRKTCQPETIHYRHLVRLPKSTILVDAVSESDYEDALAQAREVKRGTAFLSGKSR